jgi:hypothetical protein
MIILRLARGGSTKIWKDFENRSAHLVELLCRRRVDVNSRESWLHCNPLFNRRIVDGADQE